jgi:hypothetical protein
LRGSRALRDQEPRAAPAADAEQQGPDPFASNRKPTRLSLRTIDRALAKVPDRALEIYPRQKANIDIKCDRGLGTGATKMNRLIYGGLAFIVISSGACAAERSTRFWNLTRHTISELYLAPAGTTNWGDNQCKNDKDGTVDSDERLRITGTSSGLYDAKLKDVSGRVCLVRNIQLKAGEIFSIEEKDLTSCDR